METVGRGSLERGSSVEIKLFEEGGAWKPSGKEALREGAAWRESCLKRGKSGERGSECM